MASTMLFPRPEDTARGKCVEPFHYVSDEPTDLPKEEQIKARLRQLTEDSRRLRHELEQLIRYDPDRPLSHAHDRPDRKIRTADRRRKPR
jgi:hypothetical protein